MAGVTVPVLEFKQEMQGDFGTIVTLATGQQFKCMRIEMFVSRLREVVVRADGAIEYEDPDTQERVVLVPVWLRGDPRQFTSRLPPAGDGETSA